MELNRVNSYKIQSFEDCKEPEFLVWKSSKNRMDFYYSYKKEAEKYGRIAILGGVVGTMGLFYYFSGREKEEIDSERTQKITETIGKFLLPAVSFGVSGYYAYKSKVIYTVCKDYDNHVNTEEKLSESIKKVRELINAFLEDRTFITENCAQEVTCNISMNLMVFPKKTQCGHIFEGSEIEKWVDRKGQEQKCPNCRTIIKKDDLEYSFTTFLKTAKVIRAIYQRFCDHNFPENLNLTDRSEEKIIKIVGEVNKFITTIATAARKYRGGNFENINRWELDNVIPLRMEHKDK